MDPKTVEIGSFDPILDDDSQYGRFSFEEIRNPVFCHKVAYLLNYYPIIGRHEASGSCGTVLNWKYAGSHWQHITDRSQYNSPWIMKLLV